jgi:hypothetical protein
MLDENAALISAVTDSLSVQQNRLSVAPRRACKLQTAIFKIQNNSRVTRARSDSDAMVYVQRLYRNSM